MFHHRIEIFVGYMWLIGFLMLNDPWLCWFEVEIN